MLLLILFLLNLAVFILCLYRKNSTRKEVSWVFVFIGDSFDEVFGKGQRLGKLATKLSIILLLLETILLPFACWPTRKGKRSAAFLVSASRAGGLLSSINSPK